MPALTDADLRQLFGLLNEELGKAGTEGELFSWVVPSCVWRTLRVMVAQPVPQKTLHALRELLPERE